MNESHSVETPEQTNIEFTVAGIGSRALALTIDSAIQACAIFVLLVVGGIFLGARVFGGIWVTAALVIAGFLLYYGYFALFEIFWNGQTPGKRQIGIRVIKDTGRRLTALETIARNLLRIIDQLPGFYGVGMFVSLLNRQNKRLGDLVTGALVIREGSRSAPNPAWYLQSSTTRERRAPMGANLLTDEDVILIESFLQRRYELEPAIRYRMASQIFSRIERKLTISADDRGGVEHLLEAAVQERRG